MTWRLEFIHDAVNVNSTFVGQLDGMKMIVKKMGTVKLLPKITLHNVLYVPSLTFSLISIKQLIWDIGYDITFTRLLRLIQDVP